MLARGRPSRSCSMVRFSVLALGLALATGVPAAAQGNTPQPSSTLLVRLGSTRVKLDTAESIVEVLKTRKTRDRLTGSKTLRGHYLRKEKDYDKLRHKTMQQFEKAAKKAQKVLAGKKGAAEILELRTKALGVTRTKGLTKAMIKREIDPCISRLKELLLPGKDSVLAVDKKLPKAIEILREQHAELRDWYALYASMGEGLELHEDAAKHYSKYPMPIGPGDQYRVDEAIAYAMFAGLTMSAGDRKALDFNESMRKRTPHQEYLGTLDLNQIRYLLGLGLLYIDEKLSDAARDHSKDMHNGPFFDHKSPHEGKTTFSQRAANFGTSAKSENIARGQRSGGGAIRSWWYSPGHHRNMLGNHRRTGLGQHELLWTQMFGG